MPLGQTIQEAERIRAEAVADAAKRRSELIEEARRLAEHETRRLLAEVRKRARPLWAGEASGGRRQLATMREAEAYAKVLKRLAESPFALSLSKGQQAPCEATEQDLNASRAGASTGSARAGMGSEAGFLVVADPRELGLVPERHSS